MNPEDLKPENITSPKSRCGLNKALLLFAGLTSMALLGGCKAPDILSAVNGSSTQSPVGIVETVPLNLPVLPPLVEIDTENYELLDPVVEVIQTPVNLPPEHPIQEFEQTEPEIVTMQAGGGGELYDNLEDLWEHITENWDYYIFVAAGLKAFIRRKNSESASGLNKTLSLLKDFGFESFKLLTVSEKFDDVPFPEYLVNAGVAVSILKFLQTIHEYFKTEGGLSDKIKHAIIGTNSLIDMGLSWLNPVTAAINTVEHLPSFANKILMKPIKSLGSKAGKWFKEH